MSEWTEKTIESLRAPEPNSIAMGPFGSRIKKENFVSSGIPVIKGGNLTGDFLVEDDFDYLTDEKATELGSANAYRGDLVITHRGTIGQVGIIPENSKHERYVVSQSQLKVSLDRERVNPLYVYYFFKTRLGQQRLLENTAQVGVPAIARASSSVKAILVPLPKTKHEQDKIVAILKTLDDKIGLNRKLNETLEEMARALFQSWFVDFDPVKAKLAAVKYGYDPERACMAALSGKLRILPGKPKPDTIDDQLPSADELDAAIATLDTLTAVQKQTLAQTASFFPATFQESERGLIPEGWKEGTLNNVCSLNEKSWTAKNHPELLKYVDLANCKNGYILSVTEYEWEAAPSRARRVLSAGDTVVGTVRPGNRSFTLIGESEEVLTGSTGFAVLSPIQEIFREFVYLHACSDDNISRLTHLADGAAYPAVRPDVVTSYEIVLPPKELLLAYSGATAKFFDLRNSNEKLSRTLAAVRDTLLPRLLSGEIKLEPN